MEQDANELIERGVKAYQAGNAVAARKMLSQAVKTEKRNETAWWYLAQAMDDTEKREYCLRMVLKLNPDHQQAQEALELGAAWSPTPPAAQGRATDSANDKAGGGSSGGIHIPSGIPDAPESMSPNELIAFTQEVLQNSINIVTGKDGVGEATWWRFFLTVGVTGFIIGIIRDISAIAEVVVSQFLTLNIWSLVTTPFLTVISALIAVSVGCFVSHWYLTQRGGNERLVRHSYTLAEIWVPFTIPLAILGVIDSAINPLSTDVVTLIRVLSSGIPGMSAVALILTLVAAGITAYTVFLMSKALGRLYPALNNREWWIGALLTLVLISFIL